MFATPYSSADLVSASFAAASVATLGTAVLTLLGLSWVSERWRVPVALSGVALLAAAFGYLGMGQVWSATGQATAAPRYAGWFTVHPMQVATLFFLARIAGPVPVGVFWRTVVAALLMVLCRFFGDAGIFNPTLGVLLGVALWLYILGEAYFGAMSEALRRSLRPMRLAYFWFRLILTIGWAIYPILQFVDLVIGTGQARPIVVIYTVADLVNLVVPSLIVLAVAGKERF